MRIRLDQKGQISIFIAFFLPAMFLLFAIMIDIGQLVNDRIMMQNAADAGAISGAVVQAIGLNEIADLNYEIDLEYKNLRCQLKKCGIPWLSRSHAMRLVNHYRYRIFRRIRMMQERANRFFARMANHVGEVTTILNAAVNLNKIAAESVQASILRNELARFSIFTQQVSWVHYTAWCEECLVPVLVYNGTKCSMITWSPRTLPMPGMATVKTRLIKEHFPVTSYAVKAIRSRRRVFMAGREIGIEIPELVTYAAGKPIFGHIFNMRPEYLAKLVRISDPVLDPPPEIPNLSRFQH